MSSGWRGLMKISDVRQHAVPVLIYAAVVLWPLGVFAFAPTMPYLVLLSTVIAYAFALWPTYYLDQWLFGGVGIGSRLGFTLLALVLILELWPFATAATSPAFRRRKVFLGYMIVFVAGALLATWWMLTKGSVIFG